ncbi:hypothetical protein FHL15_008390 [Xylaria flabelliformis]|uniref:Uncharacterized protein n=1 Tax=Xylaria flabelliformis TaxID=2512241 RepID=A0A553HS92_9PEZI|nr:hypothetical protein FHL15_008390 [Xylaria flabelliformis]
MAFVKSEYVFRLLSVLGLLAQWGAMAANGTLLGLMITAWEGQFPNGVPMNTTWTGLWPLDYVLSLLVAFFYPILNVTDLENPAPILLLTDLLISLSVFSFMAVVEGRRRKDMSFPAAWQLAWQFFGAASIMPIYLHSYIKERIPNKPRLATHQAKILPFTAIWTVLTNLLLLVPGVMGASPFIIQLSIVVWFFLPLVTEFVENRISPLFTYYRPNEAYHPVLIGYGIVGSVSAIVHVVVGLWAYNSSLMSWKRMYWPAYSAVQPGPSLLLLGGTLFCQYGHLSLSSSVVALAAYTVGWDVFVTKSYFDIPRAGRLVVSVIAIVAVFGPGTGAAWLLYMREMEMNKSFVSTKDL